MWGRGLDGRGGRVCGRGRDVGGKWIVNGVNVGVRGGQWGREET